MTWCFSSSCFGVLFVWNVIQTGKAASISRIYQIMVVLKNRNRRYSSHYIIKFIGFMSIYYVIMLLTCILFHPVWFLAICIYFGSIRSIASLNQ